MKIKEIMKTEVVSVKKDEKINNVAQLLFKNRFHAVPVVEGEKIVGIITENDFFIKDTGNLFLPSYIDFLEKFRKLDSLPENKRENVKKLLDARAEDIMTKNCVCVSPEEDVLQLVETYRKTRYNSFPVVDKDNNLVGIVTSADIMGLIV